jgi:hypothetical protein
MARAVWPVHGWYQLTRTRNFELLRDFILPLQLNSLSNRVNFGNTELNSACGQPIERIFVILKRSFYIIREHFTNEPNTVINPFRPGP